MSFLLPRSLAGRTVMVIIIGLVVTHAATVIVFSEHRAAALSSAEEQHIAQHITSIADIVLRVPNEWRDRIVRLSDAHAFRVYMTSNRRVPDLGRGNNRVGALSELLSRQVGTVVSGPISVHIRGVSQGDEGPDLDPPKAWYATLYDRLVYGHDPDQAVLVSIPLSKGELLNFSTVLPLTNAPSWGRVLAMTGSFVVVVLLLSMWATRKLAMPLNRFAGAATAFAHNIYAPSLPETGPSEIREAARAFNNMQDQIRRLIENRAQTLTAISHDLRTPLTTVRLRVENVTEPELRSKMLTALNDMDAMLSSILAFAREGTESEEICISHIGSMVEAICEDMRDAGHEISCVVDGELDVPCRHIALKRALTNLIDNAIKYGSKAEVSVTSKARTVEVEINDEGPGIPKSELDRVFLPFYRLETSRNRTTGGVGLGMAIAQTIIEMHGGFVALCNRAGGGLQVKVHLPRSQ